MCRNNSMGKAQFLLEHLVWGFIAFLWYRIIFRCIGGLSLAGSRMVLCGILVLVSFLYGAFQFQTSRNGFSIFLNLVSGYGLYTVLTYMNIKDGLIRVTLLCVFALSIIWVVMTMSRRIENVRHRRETLIRRLRRSFVSIQILFGFGMTVIVLVLGAGMIFGNGILHTGTGDYVQPGHEEQILEDNSRTVALLTDNKWDRLSVQEKLDVLQVVARIEQCYLGLPGSLSVDASNLDEGTNGYYNERTSQIIISLDLLLEGAPERLLETVLHESFHAYQFRCLEAYHAADENSKSLRLFRRIAEYGAEFDEYEDGSEDFWLYYRQTCETDAREYAEIRLQEYQAVIEAYYRPKAAGCFSPKRQT